MSKVLSIMLCLSVFIPVMGMERELQKIKKEKRVKSEQKIELLPLIITPEENEKFVSYIKGRLGFSNTVTAGSKYVPQDNPIHAMLQMLAVDFLKDCDNDVLKLIASQGLAKRINDYKRRVDSSRAIKFCLEQIYAREGDVNKARIVVAENRHILAEQELQRLQPNYSCDYLGAVQIQHRIEYMKRNAEYPTDEKAIKDYIALLIYQVIFAHQTHRK